MPQRARRPCSHPGCPALVTDRYCPPHRHQVEQRRGSSTTRGYGSARWEWVRRQQLLAEPLCRHCLAENRLEPATDCDHITPVTGPDDPTFWTGPFQSLCHPCHSRKTLADMRT